MEGFSKYGDFFGGVFNSRHIGGVLEAFYFFGGVFLEAFFFGGVLFYLEAFYIATLKLEAGIKGNFLIKGRLLMSIKTMESFLHRASLAISISATSISQARQHSDNFLIVGEAVQKNCLSAAGAHGAQYRMGQLDWVPYINVPMMNSLTVRAYSNVSPRFKPKSTKVEGKWFSRSEFAKYL